MKLKKKYAKQSDVPAFAQFMFEEQDGAWVPREGVDIDAVNAGIAPEDASDRLAEFRTRNIELERQLRDQGSELGNLRKQFEGVDPEQFAQFQEQLAKVTEDEERRLMASGNLEEVLRRRTARLIDEKNEELKTRTKAYEDLKVKHDKVTSSFATMQAQNRLGGLISEKGLRVKKGAQSDLNDRLANDWTIDENGKLKPRREDLIGDSGGPIDPTEYVEKELLERRGFFFEPAKGGNAPGGGDGDGKPKGGSVARNPKDFGNNLEAIAKGEKTVQ